MVSPQRFSKSLFIFRRDLRCFDNTGLIHALTNSDQVIPCFIFDPRQIDEHPFQSGPALAFMLESLHELKEQVQKLNGTLFFFDGKADEIVSRMITEEKIDAVFVNEDYTPFSVQRDLSIKKLCESRGVGFMSFSDALLHDPRAISKDGGGVYTVFTPFFRKANQRPVAKPVPNTYKNFYQQGISFEYKDALKKINVHDVEHRSIKGGRSMALAILKDLRKFGNYDEDRDIPEKSLTSQLSAHHKFGTCSIRETHEVVKNQLGVGHTMIRELYWRDFFSHIGYHFPHVFGHSFHDQYDKIEWSENKQHFQLWCEGKTGFPIVDAGMRELNATGFMHNRVRMITASFLVKDLHINWQWGERYFAQKLVDYDPCVNNGNWQWAASTGCDHQPYFRIFNPWLQQKRFDPDCVYIKRWVSELKELDAISIQEWYKAESLFAVDYPTPIVDHSVESQRAKEMFKEIKQ